LLYGLGAGLLLTLTSKGREKRLFLALKTVKSCGNPFKEIGFLKKSFKKRRNGGMSLDLEGKEKDRRCG